jgi:hypothetical protein
MKKKPSTVVLPPDWQQKFKSHSLSIGFKLHLSRPMLEMLCSIADDCFWDRANYGDVHFPDNFIHIEACLEKRGLIERREGAEREDVIAHNAGARGKGASYWEQMRHYSKLTPAGKLVVEMLKLTGMFIQQDNGLRRRRA